MNSTSYIFLKCRILNQTQQSKSKTVVFLNTDMIYLLIMPKNCTSPLGSPFTDADPFYTKVLPSIESWPLFGTSRPLSGTLRAARTEGGAASLRVTQGPIHSFVYWSEWPSVLLKHFLRSFIWKITSRSPQLSLAHHSLLASMTAFTES